MKTVLNILICVLALSVSSCYQPYDQRINVREGIRSDSLENNIATRPVLTALSALIGEGIDVTKLISTTNQAGFMEIQVSGFNRSYETRRFQFKVEWFDGSGMVIGSKASTWLPVSAVGKSPFSFSSVAPSRDAADFKLNTRREQ